MDLIRLDSNPNPRPDEEPNNFRRTEYAIVAVEDNDPETSLRVNFTNFGQGTQRWPRFAVEVNWIDVKSLLCHYMKLGHPEAVHLRRMVKLAEAIEGAGWTNSAPMDFWDDFPPP